MPDYNKGCIYMIKHKLDFNNENVYIGSCCNFTRRKCEHKTRCNNPSDKGYNIKLYQTIRANGGWDIWVMIKLREYKCESKYELNLEERRVIDEYKAKLNMCVPTRTTKEWREDNNEYIIEQKKKWYENNKEKLSEIYKKYREEHKEEINEKKKKYYEEHREELNEKQKKYQEEHREERNEYNKKYREKKKEELKQKHKKWYENNKEKLNEKITCECGAIVRKYYIARHRESLKHISFFNNMKAN
jgi:hypothetical protein